jgi:hypothetical protein
MYARRSLSPAALLGSALLVSAMLAGPLPLRAGSTNVGELHMPQGTGAGTANGDYLTSTAGLNTFYRYFIEVPSGLSQFVVEVFDADVGFGGTAEAALNRDRERNGAFTSTTTYTLLRPDGTTAATTAGCDATATCTDNGWQVILNSSTAQNTAAGHWELRVTMGNGGDDINAIGVRAHDGTSGAGGTELPVYIDSLVSLGVNPPATGASSHSYSLYPYVTSGCTALESDFDYDSDAGTAAGTSVGSLVFSSRTGAFTQTIASASLSVNNVWTRNTINRWTSDQKSTEYGIWQGTFTISSYTNNLGINGNYTDLYLANYLVPATPATTAPTSNPVTNGIRMYLPTDAGAAPVKPYLEQLLTYSGCGAGNDGTNPPTVNQTSCYTVTVRLVNPTAKAVTFSAANLVTANVPGAGAVYGGAPLVSQGTVVSAPAVGGTGNITWNPGTVAAGSTQLLSYHVKVTPTSAGQRIPVTGTPASNGTTAKYVDETGNATQARALFTFGPLCELAVTQSVITQAVISSFRASPADRGGVLLEWRTASEAGTAGFYVQRWDAAARRWTRVNRELLAGLVHEPQGGVYRFVDEGAAPGEPRVYRLEEVETGGGRRIHGPFAAAMDWDRRDPRRGAATYERAAHQYPERAGRETPEVKALAKVYQKPARDGAHLPVRQTGLAYVRAADVATWFDLPLDKAGKLIAKGKLALSRGDQPVAWYPDFAANGGAAARPAQEPTAQGLFFYGQAPDSLSPDNIYSDATVYRLQKGDGLLMAAATVTPAGPGAGGSFPAALHAERDAFAATVLPLDPESDYWFWEFLQGDDPTYGHRAFPLDAPGVAAGGGALTVSLQGATASGIAGEHHALVALNGAPLGETSWTGIAARQATFAIPSGLLQETGNQVTVTAQTGSGAPYSFFYVDSFDLSYPRSFRAAGDGLAFTAGGPQVTVGGFSSPAVPLLDVADPLHPRWLTGAAAAADGAGGYQVSFAPSAQARYLAAGPAAVATLAADRAWSPAALKARGNRAAYLVIAPVALRDAAERLANLRRAQGLEAMVVDLDQIMDEFNAGSSDPHAIRAFLAWAYGHWSLPPRYVALAGAGTVDYRNLLGYGDDLVPPLMLRSASGLFPSDNLLGDVDGDGRPEVAVGRLPVLSAAELDAYTAKLAAYEGSAAADWTGRAVLVSDAPDRGADFTADSERIAAQISPLYALSRIDLATLPLADARSQLLGAFGQGAAFLNYTGHGGFDRLSSGGLLTGADVPGLTNGGRLPVVTALTCVINRFAVPGFASLGELLVKSGAGGAAAVWGPAGLSASGEARLLGERFYAGGAGPDARLGDRVLRSIADFRTLGGDPDLPRFYSILGDPALRLQPPPPPAVTGTGSGTRE